MAKNAVLKYPWTSYTPRGVGSKIPLPEARKEYSRLRKIALKRLKRMEGTEWETSAVYKINIKKYPTLKNIKSERELGYLLSDLSVFIVKPTSTLRGLKQDRAKRIATLHKSGYLFVTKENFADFTRFMAFMESEYVGNMLDSDQVARLYSRAADVPTEEEPEKRDLFKEFEAWKQQASVAVPNTLERKRRRRT